MSLKWDKKYSEQAYNLSIDNIQSGEYEWKDQAIVMLYAKILEMELGITTILSNLTGVQETVPFGDNIQHQKGEKSDE